MRITDLTVDGFGMWKGLTLQGLSPGLTVFFGPNEAGKTTLLQFVRSVLYGLADKRRRRYLPPAYGGRPGGSLSVSSPAGHFRIERHWKLQRTGDQEELTIRGSDERVVGNAVLRGALSGLDETMFNNVFAVGLTELQQLGSLSDTQAAQQLYGLAMGTDRVSLADVRSQLADRRQRLWDGDGEAEGEPCQVERLLAERKRLMGRLHEARLSTQRWSKLVRRREALDLELRKLAERELPATEDVPWDQWIRRQRGKWRRCRELQQKLGSDQGVAIPTAAVERLQEISQQLEQREAKLEETVRQQDLVRLDAGIDLDRDEPAWDVAPVLELADQRNRLRAVAEATRQGRQKLEEVEFEFQAELEKHGFPPADRDPGSVVWGTDALAALSEPARYVQEHQEFVEQYRREAEDRRREAEELKQQYRDALARLGVKQVDQAEEEIRRQCHQLQQRMAVQDRVEKAGRDLEDLQREARYWVQRMVLPWRVIILFGAVFSTGAAMMLAALWHRWTGVPTEQRGAVAIIGLCLAAASIIMRKGIEFSAQHRWEETQDQTRRIQRQRQQLAEAARDIDRQLPQAGGPWVKQLEKAERELREVQSLNPLYDRYQRALADAETMQRRAVEADGPAKDARRGWQQSLITLGLPDHLSHDQVRQLLADAGPLMRIRRRLESLRSEQKQRDAELDAWQQKIARFADRLDVNLMLSDDDPQQRLVAVVDAARKFRESQQLQTEARRKLREFQREEHQLRETMDVLQKRRQQILEQYRAADPHELQQRCQQQQQDRETREHRDQLLDQLFHTLAPHVSLDDLRHALNATTPSNQSDPVEKLLGRWDEEHTSIEQATGELRETRGKLTEQIKSLTRDQVSARLRVQLEVVDARLRETAHQWSALSAVSHVLDGIRAAYESDRQPETLAEGSTFLQKLTGGRYTRIWTPFGETTLSVDTYDGSPLPVEKLSRGAREQVYLSLRLALAAEYGRRGCSMPIVLDDVFVNFDTRRAKAAAETLREYAEQGRQVLVFTCHDHLRDIFRELGADVRTLPDARVVAGLVLPEDLAPTVAHPEPATNQVAQPEPATSQVAVSPSRAALPAEPPGASDVPLRRKKKKRRPLVTESSLPGTRGQNPLPATLGRAPVEVHATPQSTAEAASQQDWAWRTSTPAQAPDDLFPWDWPLGRSDWAEEPMWRESEPASSSGHRSVTTTPPRLPEPPRAAVPISVEPRLRPIEYDAA